jgi:hypothetical protein
VVDPSSHQVGSTRPRGSRAYARGISGHVLPSRQLWGPYASVYAEVPLPLWLWLHDLTPHEVAHLVVFVTLCECYLWIEPHSDLWQRIFWLNLKKDGDRSVQQIDAATI